MTEVDSKVQVSGTVKWFNHEKGYGFLVVPGVDKDVFLHIKQCRAGGIMDHPVEGETLGCTLNTGSKGLFASNVSRPKQPEKENGTT